MQINKKNTGRASISMYDHRVCSHEVSRFTHGFFLLDEALSLAEALDNAHTYANLADNPSLLSVYRITFLSNVF